MSQIIYRYYVLLLLGSVVLIGFAAMIDGNMHGKLFILSIVCVRIMIIHVSYVW